MIKKGIVIMMVFASSLIYHRTNATVGYNRFVPWLPTPAILPEDSSSYVSSSFYLATASNAFNTADRQVGLPEIYGNFDLGMLSRAYAKISGVNPLRAYYQDKSIPFTMDGKLQMQGFTLGARQTVTPEFSVGGSLSCMRLHTHFNFCLGDIKFTVTKEMETELDLERRILLDAMGITTEVATQSGMGDIELFTRFEYSWEYALKCRFVNAGVQTGLMFPTALTWNISQPSTILTDNSCFWGFYVAPQATFALKEDLTVDLGLYIYKRLAKTVVSRISVLGEPRPYGAAVDELSINPGLTVLFCPSVILEHLRNGLGVAVSYSMLYHQPDSFRDVRTDKSVPVNVVSMKKTSGWGADYFSVTAFYDFGDEATTKSIYPIIKLKWDIPADVFAAKKVAKTHVISLTIDCAY